MAESKAHKLLKQRAKRELKKQGFKNREIQEEYPINIEDNRFRIDVAGISEERKVAYECGNTSIEKLKILRERFDKVIWTPYALRLRQNIKQKVRHIRHTVNGLVWDGKAIERKYKIRPSWKGKEGVKGKEITLHPDWCEYNKLELGDVITILANGVMVLLPPNISEEKEAEVRRFLEGDTKTNDTRQTPRSD